MSNYEKASELRAELFVLIARADTIRMELDELEGEDFESKKERMDNTSAWVRTFIIEAGISYESAKTEEEFNKKFEEAKARFIEQFESMDIPFDHFKVSVEEEKDIALDWTKRFL